MCFAGYIAPVKVIEDTISFLGDAELASELKAIHDYYDSVQPDFDGFMEKSDISCPSGCGSCCAHFIPDVTPSEALIIGAHVLFGEKKDLLLERLQEDALPQIVCPFFDPWSEHHCMVYSVRPLVCRMFNSCASRDKNGEPSFRPCRFNLGEAADNRSFKVGKDVPIMDDYGRRLEDLEGNSADTELLPSAVMKAVDRIGNELDLICSDVSVLPVFTPEMEA